MTSKFFFGRLMDYYNGKNRLDSAKSVVDAALMCDSDNGLFLFAKSNLLLNMGRYQECIEISDALIARNDTIADVYLNAGVSYINMALALEADAKSKKKNRKKILDYYKKALPYMEKYREMAPDKKENWAQSLYNIYLRLNMGSKFEEVSDILKKCVNSLLSLIINNVIFLTVLFLRYLCIKISCTRQIENTYSSYSFVLPLYKRVNVWSKMT